MIYTVTLNTSIDYIVSVEDFSIGMVNRTVGEMVNPGGKGLNVSMVLNNLGYENIALGFAAGYTGQEIIRLLTVRNIRNELLYTSEGSSRINVKIKSDDETEINGMGPVISDDIFDKLIARIKTLTAGDILVLAGGKTSTMPDTVYADIMKSIAGRGIDVIVDATGKLLTNTLEYKPFLIKPNIHELCAVFETSIESVDDIVKYAKLLNEKGARNVLVSLGKDGAVLVCENGEIYREKAPVGTVVNSVGAGDSMVAGFIAEYVRSHDYSKALNYGICAGSVSAFNSGMATKEAVDKLFMDRNN